MTLEDVLQELILRLGSGGDTAVAWEQVREWPEGAIEAFQKAEWIKATVAASTVECPGCEKNCFMPVHVLPARNRQPARAYVGCDKRDDIGRVKIGMSRLQQWQITDGQVAGWVSGALGLKGKPQRDKASGVFTLGTLQGKKRVGCLELAIGESVCLNTSGHSVALSEVVSFEGDQLRIDRPAVRELVDLPPASESTNRQRRSTARAKAGKRGSLIERAKGQTDVKIGSAEWRRQTARSAANARHDQPGGSRDKQKQIREIWATGKYSSRDLCAEQECAAVGMSFSAARKALINKPGA